MTADLSRSRAGRWLLAPGTAGAARRALVVLLACAFIYWPRLGTDGLRATEGHRAIPAWEILDSGRWLPTRMFDAVYVRKPPGMPWAIAGSSMLFGQTEFAARAVSAASITALALATLVFATRWFGAWGGLAAGLAQALLPRWWTTGRSADIEALNALAAGLLAFLLIEALRRTRPARPRLHWRDAAIGLGAGLALAAAVLAKAHAALPVLVGVLAAVLIARRSASALRSPAIPAMLAAALAVLLPIALWYRRALELDPAPVVSERFSGFLWSVDRLGEWLVFAPSVWISALPASLALLFPWGPDARREAGAPTSPAPGRDGVLPHDAFDTARTLAWAFIVGVGVYAAFGVSNPRYALPVLPLLPALVGYVMLGAASFFTPLRARIARWMVLGHPAALAGALLLGACGVVWLYEPTQAGRSAREPGTRLARSLADGAEVWVGGFASAKPELLWYARREALAQGCRVDVRWRPRDVAAARLPPAGVLLLLHDLELEAYRAGGHERRLEVVARDVAHTTPFSLIRVLEAPADAGR